MITNELQQRKFLLHVIFMLRPIAKYLYYVA